MKTDFIDELRWRGLLQDIVPGTEELLAKGPVTGYIGFDPSSDSLHIGSLSQIITLLRFQKAGHKPIALLGGATGMVGDPSGKSAERNLLDEETLGRNAGAIRRQLEKFLFADAKSGAELINNFEWMKSITFIDFIRDVGKHITVNYLLAKDSVKSRLESGLSFTEFSYQLIQANDFYQLFKSKNCHLQMGGSDQWGNILSGTELIRRKTGEEAFALTTRLIVKSDGGKFGKTESGNVWLDRKKTSPYRFYQFWINCSDEDAVNYIKYFTFFSKAETEAMIAEHLADPAKRGLQKILAQELTTLVHSSEDYIAAEAASQVLFSGGIDDLRSLDDETFLDVFSGVPTFTIKKSELEKGTAILELLVDKTGVFPSRGEARKMIQGGGVSVNKEKIADLELMIVQSHLIRDKYIVLQKGRKNYYLVNAD